MKSKIDVYQVQKSYTLFGRKGYSTAYFYCVVSNLIKNENELENKEQECRKDILEKSVVAKDRRIRFIKF